MKVYSETSHIFKTELPAKMVANMYMYTNIHINTGTYSKVDFKKLFSQAYSEFIKIFAKIVNILNIMTFLQRCLKTVCL